MQPHGKHRWLLEPAVLLIGAAGLLEGAGELTRPQYECIPVLCLTAQQEHILLVPNSHIDVKTMCACHGSCRRRVRVYVTDRALLIQNSIDLPLPDRGRDTKQCTISEHWRLRNNHILGGIVSPNQGESLIAAAAARMLRVIYSVMIANKR